MNSLADAGEIKTFYYGLMNTGREVLGDVPVMASIQQDIEALRIQNH